MRRGSVSLPFIALFSLVLAACDNGNQQQQQAGGPPEAGFITVEPQTFTLTTELPGRTTPYQVAEIRPQVNGIIEERLFEEGQQVDAGDALYRIDDSLYQAQVESAKADLARAQATLKSTRLRAQRFERLLEMKAVSQQEYDEAQAALGENQAQVAAARAALESARINLDYTTIEAPISGRIGRSSVTAGALVTASQAQALATIRQLDPIYVDLTQSNRELRQLRAALEAGRLQKVGDDKARVTLLLEDGSAYDREGALQFSEFAVEESTGSVTLRALFPNPDSDLLPGMFVRARLPQGERSNAILVPQKGVTRDPNGNATAMVIGAEDKVEQRSVTTERAVGNQWLISDGLKAGDRLIIEGLQKIRPDAKVKPVQLDQQGDSAAPATEGGSASGNAPRPETPDQAGPEQTGDDAAQDAQ
ncbi:MAG: efflux RND transporter periplasmic adaptor subunit [Alcanivorax sp.]|uniref:Efflux RND transporter periplasmic adaptor subunit n=1 Tax=Alloalcanivorax marinus TaxID=1177169 RepID=A0A9Q3YSH3_9GAMM|nr:efflux RND transporter periplasmic adaptor subunit [Alloalcanivorax marinus]MBM7334298.1 efflux RND transporter periplasmic adaptor subunit [Alloalcanivorax marinus]MCC4309618.1 efflux RND transporter periplasmic adaptor subunit [Alloalcanivorax marinus]